MIPAVTTFANPDPGIKFTTQQDEINLLNSLVTTTIPADLNTYVISTTTPAVEDQDKLWQRLNTNGSPLGLYIYWSGLWVLQPPPPSARVGLFFGDPTVQFDANGKGLPGPGPVAFDFYGWQICNGLGGTANFSDRFVIGARMDNAGISGWDSVSQRWRTNVRAAPESVGGVISITTDVNSSYRPARSAIKAGKYSADGNVQGGALWGDANGSTDFTVLEADVGNVTPLPINVINPFIASAFVAWIGYVP